PLHALTVSTLLLLLLLSSHGYLHPLPLYSFPTRRSSDLLSHGVVWAGKRTKVRKGTYADCEDAAMVVICAGAAQKPGETRLQLVDRKSTRLNSSHVSISYAVFCLKKKNLSSCWLIRHTCS